MKTENPIDISEEFKTGVHLTMFGLAVAAGLYNWAESRGRSPKYLKVNAVANAGLALYEMFQISRHLKAQG